MAVRREHGTEGMETVGGVAIKRNPGVAMLWVTASYTVQRVPNGAILRMGAPLEVLWYAQGRLATREEVEESIRTGLPALEELAMAESYEAMMYLDDCYKRMLSWLPKAA